MNRLSLLTIIANHLDEEKYIDFLSKEKTRFKNIIHATGTASNSVLEYFGLDEVKKIIIICVVLFAAEMPGMILMWRFCRAVSAVWGFAAIV